MDKIVCEVCGTSYSESAAQCPICGFANSGSADIFAAGDIETGSARPQYQQVKGGRFSAKNVKKRNQQKAAAAAHIAEKPIKKKPAEQPSLAPEPAKPKKAPEKKKAKKSGSNRGLVITVLVLLLAIIAVIGYIAVTFVLPVVMPKKDAPKATEAPVATAAPTAAPGVPCTDIELNEVELIFNALGETAQLTADPVPVNTTDELIFTSADPAVATVDESGLVTAVGAGYTEITVSCGDTSVNCVVTVNDDSLEFVFDQETVTLTTVGEACVIYSGSIPVSEIVWYSDDDAVATIQDGSVVAVGAGTTTVYGEYEDLIISCTVNCTVVEETEPTEPTVDMAAIEANGPYRLDNPYGVSDTDASIKVGVSFTLYLLDKNGNKVTDAKWSVENGSSCKVVNGKVTGLAKGNCDIVATYGGKTYTCIVRVS